MQEKKFKPSYTKNPLGPEPKSSKKPKLADASKAFRANGNGHGG